MTLTSFSFFVFLLIVIIAFYIFNPFQKYILLAASVYFYISISSVNAVKLIMLMFGILGVTYIGALIIEHVEGKVKSLFLVISISMLVLVLFLLKYAYNILGIIVSIFNLEANISCLQFVSIIGISYYALSAIGYLIDIYWGNYKASKNPVDVALFIFYFPQLISGPFTRFPFMDKQFNKRNKLDYGNLTSGMRRMAWGYFKKLVISERFGIIVSAVYGNYEVYSFVGIVGATLCYAVQLYTDFSGCMDIIMGASMLFGIELPENFKAPFFSETIQEFWQRWHITLGTWFKDYFMYPVQKSKPIQNVAKWSKKKFGKKAGKKVPFYVAMLMLWILIGIWHGGTGYYFIASAGIPCILLILSDLCQPLFAILVKTFKVNTECKSWCWFRRVRTLLLICICWIVACSGGTYNAINIFRHMFITPINYTPFTVAMETFGLNTLDILLMSLGMVIIYSAHKCEYEGTTIMRELDGQNWGIKVLLIYVEVIVILLHGMVGSSAFIYFQF